MIIKEKIRDNIALNAHPKGCEQNIINQLNEIEKLESIEDKPLNVLIIGGSSGYGLASRLVLALKNKAFTYNVSLESAPTDRLVGSAGYYNNYFFNKIAKENNLEAFDLNADCFSHQTKDELIEYFKNNNKKIDLIIYSVASPVRIDPDTQEKYVSSLKPIGKPYVGLSVDMMKEKLIKKELEPASEEEIKNTIKVMGGEDFLLWIQALDKAQLLNQDVKAITYTYLGSPITYIIYRDGTIGQAKKDLAAKNIEINKILEKYNGVSRVCAAKAVVTKASNYIPTVPLYIGALYKVMKKHNVHETIIQHIYRLYKDMVYGDKLLLDDEGFIRLDSYELQEDIQKETTALIDQVNEENFYQLLEYEAFKNEFLNINGFRINGVDYDEDIDLEQYK